MVQERVGQGTWNYEDDNEFLNRASSCMNIDAV